MSQIKEISLNGKVAIVTGAASGIGEGIALRLADAGARVAILDLDEEGGKGTVAAIEKSGGEAEFFRCNVTSSSDCETTVQAVNDHYGGLDVLVNNAGIIKRKTVVKLSEEEWDRVLSVNLKAPFLLSKYSIPFMADGEGGSIINVSSGWGLKGGPKAVSYCASKAGLINLSRAMAIDHGREGVRVNCVSPGDTDTGLLRDEADQLGEDEEEFLRQAADRPLERLGSPLDIGNAVLFLASDLADWVTGTNLVVDGGGLA